MKVLIVVPVFNESRVIFDVLNSIKREIRNIPNTEIILVDDGSQDGTIHKSRKAGIEYVSHVINRGLGAAIKTGFEIAKQKKADILVTFDGDGQHNPKDIQKLIKPIIENKADFVVGSRFIVSKSVPLDRLLINWVANAVTFALYGAFSSDSQSGLRAFSKNAISKIEIKADRMDFSSELFLEAKRNSLKVFEVPIEAIYTGYSRKKGQQNLNAIPVFARLITKILR